MDIVGLIPSFGGVIWTLGAFVLALLIIVAVHEYGHYIVGRWTGIHAEVFSLGFGPVLWSGFDKHGTRWQIAALPLGGYVRFLGDADAASGKDGEAIKGMNARDRRATMHGAPLWARSLTVAAGPAFNFALSIIVFAAILLVRGTASDPLTIAEVLPLPGPAQELRVGDEILAINGTPTPAFEEFDSFVADLPRAEALDYTVLRDGGEQVVQAPFPYPPLVSGLTPDSAAMDAGMQVGDVIVAIDGTPVVAFADLREMVGASGGKPLLLDVWNEGDLRKVTLVPRSADLPVEGGGFETRWLIGISGGLMFEPATQRPGVFEAVGYGAERTVFVVTSSISGLYHMIAGQISSCNLRGPIGIAQTSGAAASQGWTSFIWFIAVLSTAVGLLNLFPIPVLDGGHLVFHAFEAVTGRPPSDRALRILMGIGLTAILALMVFALSNDLFCP
ncbi:MAG: RIP metalloprotease RseP [Rhodobacteraceae bacterium]|nr:RIP metalloprotease RseP [Paracoccaceae bacterium]